jgi:hypothetical protein
MAQKFKYIYIKDLGNNSISYIQNDMIKIAPATTNAQKSSQWTMNPVFYTTLNANDLHNFEFHATNTNPASVTGINEPSFSNFTNANCFIYNDQLNITLDDTDQINQLYVYNMSGQKILSQFNISNKAIIDLNEFPRGFYIIEVWNNQTVLRKKILY